MRSSSPSWRAALRSNSTSRTKISSPTASEITELEKDLNIIIVMASIAILVVPRLLLAVMALGGGDTAAQEEKVRHDKALKIQARPH